MREAIAPDDRSRRLRGWNLPFWFGAGAGIVPWIAISIQLARAQAETGAIPGFVSGILFSLLVLFALSAAREVPVRAGHPVRSHLRLHLVARGSLG